MEKRSLFCWWCPSAGTQEYIGSGEHVEEQSFNYINEVGKACEMFGFDDLLIPISAGTIDPIIAACSIGNVTYRLNLMIAIRPGYWNPVHFARTISSLSKLYPERIKINLVEGNIQDCINYGDRIEFEKRSDRRIEFLEALVPLLKGQITSYNGKFFNITNCQLPRALSINKLPEIMVSGHTDESFLLGKEYSDTILFYGSSLNGAKDFISKINNTKSYRQKDIKIGMSIQIIARKTKSEAKEAANKFISKIRPAIKEEALAFLADRPLIDGIDYKSLESREYWYNDILWYGMAKAKTHQRATLVGSYSDIVCELRKYEEIGISYFILTADPNLDELNHIGENILPFLKRSKY
jgi:alkanesulfonate monooxygenase